MEKPTTYAEREEKRLHTLLNAAASGDGVAHISETQQEAAITYLTQHQLSDRVALKTFPDLVDFLEPARRKIFKTPQQG